MIKRVISAALCLVLLVSLAAPAVYAQQPSAVLTGNDPVIGENLVLNDVQVDGTPITQPEQTDVTQPTGEASATLDGATVNAQGIPEGGTVTVENTQVPDARQALISELEVPDAQELFTWDISVQDASGADWQPEGTVELELSLPDVKLHPYSKVYVLHEAEDGTRSYIAAKVTEDGTLSFVTDGFSTFAGFTVDFDYEGASFSMDGLDSILLSQLLEELQAPLYAEDVTGVSFSDPSLLSVTEQEGDWLLTSLEAFSTTEELTLTMADGQTHTIAVTDAQYATVTVGSSVVQTDGQIEWHADSDGTLRWYEGWNGGWALSQSNDVYISGGDLEILIKPDPLGTNYLVLLKSIIIQNGANVTVRLSDGFAASTECVLRTSDGSRVFRVDSGTLTLQGNAAGAKLVVDGNASKTIYNPLIETRNSATRLSASNVSFRNGANGGVWVRSSVIAVDFTNCVFESTVKTSANNGGAIWLFEGEYNTNDYVQVTNFTVSGCQFNGNQAANGGAIAMGGKVYGFSITDSQFTGCTSTNGGAINISGSVGNGSISGCSFVNCIASGSGGGINLVSDSMDETGNSATYSRTTLLSISNSTFSGCQATQYSGGGICVSMQIAKLSVLGCDFTNCKSAPSGGGYRGGGAICLAYKTLPTDFAGTWTGLMAVDGVTVSNEYYTWSDGTKETVIQEVEIKGSTNDLSLIENCSSGNQGGGIIFVPQVVVGKATIDYVHIDGCSTVTEGSAIFLGDCIVKSLDIKNSLIENCYFATNHSRDGGTVRVLGSTTCVMTMENCTVQNNNSHHDGGGLYWNANGINRGGVSVCSATLRNCTFTGNTAGRSGGGIYCAGVLNIYDCEITENTAVVGGGIYQMVYSNSTRPITAGESTELTLDPNTNVFKNTATNGAGIAIICNATASIANTSTIPYTVKFRLNGANVYENTASSHGGGIYFRTETYSDAGDQAEVDRFTKEILIDNGTIYSNTAGHKGSGNGGGIYMDSSENTVLGIVGGHIHSNTANQGNGGGIYLTGKNAVCTVTGGTVGGEAATSTQENPVGLPNYAVRANNLGGNGGGIAISGGAGIHMKLAEGQTSGGGTISFNQADQDGGGIWLDAIGSNQVKNTLTIEEGVITCNSADNCGGGIGMLAQSQAELKGGRITRNRAVTSGGGVYSDQSDVTVTGGTISENTAQEGGGIAANRSMSHQISVSGGDIQSNIATKNGGGIYAYETKVELTGGKISENTAINGGGLYIVNGAELTVSNGFIIKNKAVTTENSGLTTCYQEHDSLMGVGGGIYLANGTGSQPSKFTLEGDSNYAIYGNIASFAADDVFANGQNTQLRVPTVANMSLAEYPLPAIGWVEDYPVDDSAYEEGLNHGASKGVANGTNVFRYRNSDAYYRIMIPEQNVTLDTFTPNAANAYVCMTLGIPSALADTVVIDYGMDVKIHVKENDIGVTNSTLVAVGALRPEPTDSVSDLTRDSLDPNWNITDDPCSFGSVALNSADDTIIYTPHSLMMDREDSFSYAVRYVHTDDSIYYFYSTVSVIPATSIYYEDSFITFDENWTQVGSTENGTQGEDRPGSLNDYDANQIYGFDGAYDDCTTWSMGGAKMVTVDSDTSATATFRFKGTGFQVFSMTSNTTGTVLVTLTRLDEPGDPQYIMVDTYYGYEYDAETGKWIVSDSTEANGLYQIPVIQSTGLPYGEYEVELYVAYGYLFDHNGTGSYNFYLDAIRIFDPANSGATSQTVQDAYVADKEGWPVYQELRNMLLNAESFNSEGLESVSGIVFVDGKSDGVSISQYQNYGPNNEVYLAPGQSIVFDLNKDLDLSGIAAVHLGMKSVGSQTASVSIYRVEEGQQSSVILDTDITSATERYYDITGANGSAVVIRNDGTSGILSITNVKTTHPSGAVACQLSTFQVSGSGVRNALGAVYAQAPTVSLKYPSLSFESEISYHIYYSVEGAELALEDMGLITFDSALEEGTVEDAVNVFPGAVSKDGLYAVRTAGIPAKNMGDDLYFKVYLKLANGSYVYSRLESYSAVDYAQGILNRQDAEPQLKQLMVALLNYGTAAQSFFGYRADAPMNGFLSQEQQTQLVSYSPALIAPLVTVDSSKEGSFASNGGFLSGRPSVTFGGAFSIDYCFTPAYTPDNGVTLYFWDQQTYEANQTLTAENAISSLHIPEADQGVYAGSFTGIAAKQIDETVFVAATYEAEGQLYTDGVRVYSLGAYCSSMAEDTQMRQIATTTAIYGYYAKQYLAND